MGSMQSRECWTFAPEEHAGQGTAGRFHPVSTDIQGDGEEEKDNPNGTADHLPAVPPRKGGEEGSDNGRSDEKDRCPGDHSRLMSWSPSDRITDPVRSQQGNSAGFVRSHEVGEAELLLLCGPEGGLDRHVQHLDPGVLGDVILVTDLLGDLQSFFTSPHARSG